MKEKKQSLKSTIVVWSIAMAIFIVGNMLSANPVRALNELVFQSPLPTPTTEPTSSPTPDPTSTPTPDPTSTPTTDPTSTPAVLKINGPESVTVGEKVQLSVEAQNVSGNGLYGVQFEVNFDPSLLSVSNLQVNSDLSFVLKNTADNTTGKISLVASRQGPVPGLTGNVNLLTFDVTAVGGTGTATLSLANAKMGDPQAAPLEFTSENFTLLINEGTTTPEPTSTPTDEPTPQPTDEPTPQPTDKPTPQPTDEPTPQPTDEPTPQPTDEPTPQPTDEPTPQPTDEPGNASVSGQVIVTGRANNNWSGGTVTVDDAQQSATTDAGGNFAVANVVPGPHSSITADAPGYLPAVCAAVTITAPQTALLPVNLLSGDVNDDKLADIADATAIGVSFGQTGPNQLTDINRDEIVDIFDVILVSINFGQGVQTWSCQTQ